MAGETEQPQPQSGPEPQRATPPGDATGPNGGAGAQTPAITFVSREDYQKAVEEALKERLDRERKKTEAATAKAREDAEAEALVKNQEFQTLAEKRGKQVETLTAERDAATQSVEAVTGERDRYRATLDRFLARERTGVPDHITALLDRMDPVDQLDYLAAHREALTPAAAVPVVPTPVPSSPRGVNSHGLTDAQLEERRRQTVYRQARL